MVREWARSPQLPESARRATVGCASALGWAAFFRTGVFMMLSRVAPTNLTRTLHEWRLFYGVLATYIHLWTYLLSYGRGLRSCPRVRVAQQSVRQCPRMGGFLSNWCFYDAVACCAHKSYKDPARMASFLWRPHATNIHLWTYLLSVCTKFGCPGFAWFTRLLVSADGQPPSV